MKEFVEKLIERLEELKKIEYDRKDYADSNDYYEDWEDAFEDGESNGKHYAYAKALEIVKQLAEECKSNLSENLTGWIPCTLGLPEEESNVIITTKAGNVLAGLYTKRYGNTMKEGFMCDNCFIYLESVVAWMSLPEPYKPKEIPVNHYIERFNKVN